MPNEPVSNDNNKHKAKQKWAKMFDQGSCFICSCHIFLVLFILKHSPLFMGLTFLKNKDQKCSIFCVCQIVSFRFRFRLNFLGRKRTVQMMGVLLIQIVLFHELIRVVSGR